METKQINIKLIETNNGQIEGLPKNPRFIRDERFEALRKSIQDAPEMLQLRELIVIPFGGKYVVIAGNMRLRVCKDLGYKELPCKVLSENTSVEKLKEYTIKDNVSYGQDDMDALFNEWDVEELKDFGFELPKEFDFKPADEIGDETNETKERGKLSERFIIPPFSVLDTKQGAWQDRRRYWLSLGIRSELGREAKAYSNNNHTMRDGTKFYSGNSNGTSVFDPVLCELSYKWFNVKGGRVLDPFAGGSVRGIVAAKLGFEYFGNDLREEQITANKENAREVLQDAELFPTWTVGDSLNIDKIATGYRADFVFSCPPYADLEVYSDKKEDLSNMEYDEFLSVYREIIRKSCEMLNENRFAVFVVGDVRDRKGFYRNFVSETIRAFTDAGLLLYNEMILVNSVGSLAIRVGKQFSSGRKVGKQHQNVLVFFKGNPKTIKENYKELDLSYMKEIDQDE